MANEIENVSIIRFLSLFSAWIYCNLAFEIEWEKDAEQKQRNPVLVFK